MCGRYTLTSSGEQVATLFDLVEMPQLQARYNMAPTQEAPVVRMLAPGGPRLLSALRWGLVPYWADDPAIGNRMINARSESVAEKPAYRTSFKKKRCLVVTDGFYEWKKAGKAKQPYLIRRRDRQPFAFAGLWSSWKNPAAPEQPLETFTILTTGANGTIRELHDRMPVILDRADFGLWLDPGVGEADRLLPLLVPAADDLLETFPVSRSVNSPAHDAADCIEPLVDHAPEEPRQASLL
jgi:putative SOS response-associated peptidase YedK